MPSAATRTMTVLLSIVLATSTAVADASRTFGPLRDAIAERVDGTPTPTSRRERRDARVLNAALGWLDSDSNDVVSDLSFARKAVAGLARRFGGDAEFEPLIADVVADLDRDVAVRLAATRAVHGNDGGRQQRRLQAAERSLARAHSEAKPSQALGRLRDAARKIRSVARKLVPKRLTAAEALSTVRTTLDAPGLSESSGLAFLGGAFWTHGDSGTGAVLHRSLTLDFANAEALVVPGVTNVDWEDLAVLGGDLLVCDIGDNAQSRADVAVHRVHYVPAATGPARLELVATYPLAYPDGAHDAEAALVVDGVLHIVIKRRSEADTGVYRFADLRTAAELPADTRNVGERTATLDLTSIDAVTAADVDESRGEIALLTYTRVVVYPINAFAGPPARSVPLRLQLPPFQYESLVSAGGWLIVGAEGGEVFAVSEFAARE